MPSKMQTSVAWVGARGSAPTDASIYVSRRRVNDLFLRGALESFAKDGPAAFAQAARENPASYLKVFALLMPRRLNVKTENVAASLSDERLALMVAELEEGIARRLAAGEGAKVVDAKALPAPDAPRETPPAPKRNRLMREADTSVYRPRPKQRRKPRNASPALPKDVGETD